MNRAIRFLLALLLALAAPQAFAQLFLWEVSSLTNRAYLYGTVHAGKASWYPLPARVEQALADSEVLVVEADITDAAAFRKMGSGGEITPPDTLRNHVAPEDYERFLKLLPRYGLTEASVAQMKPFMAVSLLVFGEWARNGYAAQYGIDQYLIRKARAEVKTVLELEGLATQVELVDSIGAAEGRVLFSGTLTALQSDLTSEQIRGMVGAWQSGDPKALLEIARKYNELVPGAREFEEKFIWSRHEAMVKKIEEYLDGSRQRHFIAVGSLHLAGERGLVEMLRKRGYIVRQQ